MGASGASGGGGGGGAAGGSSLASIGLSAYSTILQAQGVAAGNDYQAKRLEVAAEYGDLKAEQTNAGMSRDLATTLGNIDAVRAAAHADPNSPTGAAYRDNQEMLGTEQRVVTVGNIKAQATQQRADAAYYKQAAKDAMFAGKIGAAAGILKGINSLGMPGGG